MKIYGIGGFNEVGKNMTAVDLGEDVILFDCGFFLPPIVELEEGERVTARLYNAKREDLQIGMFLEAIFIEDQENIELGFQPK